MICVCAGRGIRITITDLSIRMSLVGSIELFLDPVLDDPRLGLDTGRAPPPLRGVRVNWAIGDEANEVRRRGCSR